VCCCNKDDVIIQSLQNIQRLFLQYGKGLNMTIISVANIEGNLWIRGRFCTVYNSAKVGSPVDCPNSPVKRLTLSVFEKILNSSAYTACNRSDNRTTQSGLYSLFEKILNSSAHAWWRLHATIPTLGKHRPDARATPSRRGDWSLMKKCVKRVMDVSCCLSSGRPLSKSERRPENSESELY